MQSLVVAHGEPPSPQLLCHLSATHDLLVAVDGGLYSYLQAGITPHLLMGDFDSVSQQTRSHYTQITQIEMWNQNMSDLEKAIDYLFLNGTDQITVCGALGRRIDHTLTNLCILCRYPDRVKFWSEYELCFALPLESQIPCSQGQVISLMPFSTEVRDVYTQGLKWELKGEHLTKRYVSISNVCLKEKIGITFSQGDLIVCMNL